MKVCEDDIICMVKTYLEDIGYFVLISSGSQTKYFFELSNGKRKCPDIIAIKENKLLVIEAKVKVNGIFSIDSRGFSDYSFLSYIQDQKGIQDKFVYMILKKLRSMDIEKDNLKLYTSILANGKFEKYDDKLNDNRIGVISTDYINNKIYIEHDYYGIFKQ